MRTLATLLLAVVISVVEAWSVLSIHAAEHIVMLVPALGLHVAAAGMSFLTGYYRRGGEMSPVECDAILWTALFVPLFGPPLAWAIPHLKANTSVEDAHQVFEKYEEHVRPTVPDYERTLFTGDFDRDLARELDAESYYEVLRNGNTDQKRNALKSLADMGKPKHLELVRRCLEDPEQEVRLYAYSEIERLGRVYEERIEEQTKQAEQEPNNPDVLCALSETYYVYGMSGVLDTGLSAYHFRIAVRNATKARVKGHDGLEPSLIQALALVALGDNDAARRTLGELAPEKQQDGRVCLVRARIAYLERDFEAARIEVETMDADGAEVPPWLDALRKKPDEEPDAPGEDPEAEAEAAAEALVSIEEIEAALEIQPPADFNWTDPEPEEAEPDAAEVAEGDTEKNEEAT